MSGSLFIRNRQRTVPVNVRQLRWLTRALLTDSLFLDEFDLAIYLVSAPAMTRLNETYLRHAGSTDVITFNYQEPPNADCEEGRTVRSPASLLHGEIFVCLDEAVAQARRFRTTWQSELTRYVIHGILHLRGYDDVRSGDRKGMKREEDRLLRVAAGSFPLRKLAAKPKLRA